MPILDTYNFKELLGLEILSEEDFNAFLSKTLGIIYQKAFISAEEKGHITKELKNSIIEMEDNKKNEDSINEYISENVPQIVELIEEETDNVKVTMLKEQVSKFIEYIKEIGTFETVDINFLDELKLKLSDRKEVSDLIPKYHQLRGKYKY